MKTLIKGTNGTRMPKGRHKTFDGIINEAPLFGKILAFDVLSSEATNQLIKGLFAAQPDLIHATAQQMAVEVAVQRAGSRELCNKIGITKEALRQLLAELVANLPLYDFSTALSRMKQHDKDLADDPRTKEGIRQWRRDHPPIGTAEARTATRAKSDWTNRATNALSQIDQANAIKANNPTALAAAPVLALCAESGKTCRQLTITEVTAIYPEVK